MHAYFAENDRLILKTVPDPEPTPDEILVEVKAMGVNHADLMQRRGHYPPPPGITEILGLEVAGIVSAVGSQVSRFQKGDRVMCLLPGGGYAEKACIHEGCAMPLPDTLSFTEAAAIPEVFLTAYQALFLIGNLTATKWVLIHAGGSGVGTAAIQLAHHAGAKSIATSRTLEKVEKCLSLGADVSLHTPSGEFAKKVLEITEGKGANLILDFVGKSYFEENLSAASQEGKIVFLSALGGSIVEKLDLKLLLKKWLSLTGTTLRTRTISYKTHLVKTFSHFALSSLERKEIRPVIHAALPWEEAEKGHELLANHRAFGKIILTIS